MNLPEKHRKVQLLSMKIKKCRLSEGKGDHNSCSVRVNMFLFVCFSADLLIGMVLKPLAQTESSALRG